MYCLCTRRSRNTRTIENPTKPLPSHVIGFSVYDWKSRDFVFHRGTRLSHLRCPGQPDDVPGGCLCTHDTFRPGRLGHPPLSATPTVQAAALLTITEPLGKCDCLVGQIGRRRTLRCRIAVDQKQTTTTQPHNMHNRRLTRKHKNLSLDLAGR